MNTIWLLCKITYPDGVVFVDTITIDEGEKLRDIGCDVEIID